MGYLFLGISLLAGATKGFCGKKISGKVESMKGTCYINMIRMVLCTLIGFFVVASEEISMLKIDLNTLVITALSGISTAMFVISWIISVRKGAYVMLDVFLMMGVGITVALCRIFFGEQIQIYQYIGYFMLVVAACILCSYSSNIKNRFTVKSFLILLICCISNGLADFSQKWFVYTVPSGSAGVFNFYTYVFSALVLMIFFMIENKIEIGKNDGKSFKIFLVICLMSICLFANSYFKTLAAKYIDSATLYPLSTGIALIIAVMMGSLFFKEKITVKCVLGSVIAFAALIIMNLSKFA